MKNVLLKLLAKHESMLCAIAVTASAVIPLSCRGAWYQPKEPDGFEGFMQKNIEKIGR